MPYPNVALEAFAMTLPPEGPLTVPVNLDMSLAAEYEIDITQLVGDGTISYISGAWIDNVGNDQDVTLVCNGTNQRVIIPAGSQGWYSLLQTNPPKFQVSQSAVGDLLRLIFVNFPVWPWMNVETGTVPGTPSFVRASGPTITDYSLALSGASEALFAAGNGASYFFLYNPAGNGDVSLNLAGGDASAVGIVIPAGGSFELTNGVANAVTVDGTAADNVTVFAG